MVRSHDNTTASPFPFARGVPDFRSANFARQSLTTYATAFPRDHPQGRLHGRANVVAER